MDAWWLAPVGALGLSGVVLLVAGVAARRSSAALEAELPTLEGLAEGVDALHADLCRLGDRVDAGARGAGTGTDAR